MSIGTRLKEWRASQNLGQKDASSKCGVSFSTYQNYELDISPPGAKSLQGFIAAGINANWLLTGKGSMLLSEEESYPKAKPFADNGQIDTDLLSEIAMRFEIASKAWVEENDIAMWVFEHELFPKEAAKHEKPSDAEIEALLNSCALNVAAINMIGSIYNDVFNLHDPKEREKEIVQSSFSFAMFFRSRRKEKTIQEQIDDLKSKWLLAGIDLEKPLPDDKADLPEE